MWTILVVVLVVWAMKLEPQAWAVVVYRVFQAVVLGGVVVAMGLAFAWVLGDWQEALATVAVMGGMVAIMAVPIYGAGWVQKHLGKNHWLTRQR